MQDHTQPDPFARLAHWTDEVLIDDHGEPDFFSDENPLADLEGDDDLSPEDIEALGVER
jgi:hypothetical protein